MLHYTTQDFAFITKGYIYYEKLYLFLPDNNGQLPIDIYENQKNFISDNGNNDAIKSISMLLIFTIIDFVTGAF
ncbi:hypothetical protein SAMN05421579_1443 [Xenorhabdus japonica]|uniref:Uncharacterized protein n=1 Tax=Xenorhabdus japonica TaxID=53341 RepID=A0A1I5DPD2_9GAMM|nr:hypothetical protein SAMN05421579_1443 [Xenorhabdus japonica]